MVKKSIKKMATTDAEKPFDSPRGETEKPPSPADDAKNAGDLGASPAPGTEFAALGKQTKGSTSTRKMGIKLDCRDGPNGRQPAASRCDLCL